MSMAGAYARFEVLQVMRPLLGLEFFILKRPEDFTTSGGHFVSNILDDVSWHFGYFEDLEVQSYWYDVYKRAMVKSWA